MYLKKEERTLFLLPLMLVKDRISVVEQNFDSELNDELEDQQDIAEEEILQLVKEKFQ